LVWLVARAFQEYEARPVFPGASIYDTMAEENVAAVERLARA